MVALQTGSHLHPTLVFEVKYVAAKLRHNEKSWKDKHKEGLAQGLWYLFAANETCGTRLCFILVNNRFQRIVASKDDDDQLNFLLEVDGPKFRNKICDVEEGFPEDLLGETHIPNLLPHESSKFRQNAKSPQEIWRSYRFLVVAVQVAEKWCNEGECGGDFYPQDVIPKRRTTIPATDEAIFGVASHFEKTLGDRKRKQKLKPEGPQGQDPSPKKSRKDDPNENDDDKQGGPSGSSKDRSGPSGGEQAKDQSRGAKGTNEQTQAGTSGGKRTHVLAYRPDSDEVIWDWAGGRLNLRQWVRTSTSSEPVPEERLYTSPPEEPSIGSEEESSSATSALEQQQQHSTTPWTSPSDGQSEDASASGSVIDLDAVLSAMDTLGLSLKFISPGEMDAVVEEIASTHRMRQSNEQSGGQGAHQ
jgi:hypothetical protein